DQQGRRPPLHLLQLADAFLLAPDGRRACRAAGALRAGRLLLRFRARIEHGHEPDRAIPTTDGGHAGDEAASGRASILLRSSLFAASRDAPPPFFSRG